MILSWLIKRRLVKMEDDLRILYISDSINEETKILKRLRKSGFKPEILVVTDVASLLESLHQVWDIILCKFELEFLSWADAIRIVRDRDDECPLLVLASSTDDEKAAQALSAGAQDFITMNALSKLVPIIRRELEDTDARRKRREAELALAESEKRYRLLIESIDDTFYVLDEDGRIFDIFTHQSKFGMKDVNTFSHISHIVPGDIANICVESVKLVKSTGESRTTEFCLGKALDRRWYSARFTQHENQEHVVMILSDITRLKDTERNLRSASLAAQLYLDLLGHDVRNHLQAITIGADLLHQVNDEDTRSHLCTQIISSVNQCVELIRHVQRTRDLFTTPLILRNLISAISYEISRIREGHDCKIVTDFSSLEYVYIFADSYLEILISHLLENAVFHNPSEDSTVWCSIKKYKDSAELIVADNGPGLPDSIKESLFDPKKRHVGIGLHQVKQIAEKYEARIYITDRIKDEYQNGLKIRVWFPLPPISELESALGDKQIDNPCHDSSKYERSRSDTQS